MTKRFIGATPSEEDLEKYQKMSNALNTSELTDLF
jgi:hypothetical protein